MLGRKNRILQGFSPWIGINELQSAVAGLGLMIPDMAAPIQILFSSRQGSLVRVCGTLVGGSNMFITMYNVQNQTLGLHICLLCLTFRPVSADYEFEL